MRRKVCGFCASLEIACGALDFSDSGSHDTCSSKVIATAMGKLKSTHDDDADVIVDIAKSDQRAPVCIGSRLSIEQLTTTNNRQLSERSPHTW
eukprot:6474754-Amphidinium_carterae.1